MVGKHAVASKVLTLISIQHAPELRPQTSEELENAPAAGKKATKKGKAGSTPFQKLERIITASRQLPTIQLFDAVWHTTFQWLSRTSKRTLEYLQKQYIKPIKLSSMSKRFRCKEALREDVLWFGGFWSGIVGTYPGSASGTQTIESFHSAWQRKLQRDRVSPVQLFDRMQQQFDEWADKFRWDDIKEFATWPTQPAQALINGQSLRTAGRSPAIDFWQHREKNLKGLRNFSKVYRRTSGTDSDGQTGMTTFWVMHTRKTGGSPAAQSEVCPTMAKQLVDMLVHEGKTLEKDMQTSKIIIPEKNTNSINEVALARYFLDMAVVMRGDLPNSAWPRSSKQLDMPAEALLCTCLPFLLHAECEHVLYVKALEDMDGFSLKHVRAIRPRGRKRKSVAEDGVQGPEMPCQRALC